MSDVGGNNLGPRWERGVLFKRPRVPWEEGGVRSPGGADERTFPLDPEIYFKGVDLAPFQYLPFIISAFEVGAL